MSGHHRLVQLTLRRTAWLLALICLWLSTGGALFHTDDMLALRSGAAGHSALRHATPPIASLPCAACEWEQTLPTLSMPTVHVVQLPLLRLRREFNVPAAAHLRPFDYTCPRGPPCELS